MVKIRGWRSEAAYVSSVTRSMYIRHNTWKRLATTQANRAERRAKRAYCEESLSGGLAGKPEPVAALDPTNALDRCNIAGYVSDAGTFHAMAMAHETWDDDPWGAIDGLHSGKSLCFAGDCNGGRCQVC